MQTKRTDATAHAAEQQPTHAPILPDENQTLSVPRPLPSESRGDWHNSRARAVGVMAAVGFLAALGGLPGCTAALDAKIAATHAEYRGAVKTSIGASRIFADGYDDLANKKHELQATGIARDWQAWLDRHTSDDGRLVSRDATGAIVPLLASDLNAAITLREDANLRLALSRESHAKFSHVFRDALTTLETTTDLLDQKTVEWETARAKANEAQSAILQAVGAAAAFMAGGL